jgi:CRISPR/Cas system-associated exonuclease Cas4 (RecB family)
VAVQNVHYSQIQTYDTCPRMYRYRYVDRLVPVSDNPKLFFGTGIHKGLEVFYSTNNAQEALLAYDAWLDTAIEAILERGGDASVTEESSVLGKALLEAYMAYAAKEDEFIATHVEQKFEVPIWSERGTPLNVYGKIIQHQGTIDGIVRDNYGRLRLMEHKTAKDFPSDLSLQLNQQVSYYLLAANQLFDEQVTQVVYNVIRKMHPKKARSPIIQRKIVTRTPAELHSAKRILARKVFRMLTDRDLDPAPGMHCGWQCAYSALCTAEQAGYCTKETIATAYKVLPEDDAVEEVTE